MPDDNAAVGKQAWVDSPHLLNAFARLPFLREADLEDEGQGVANMFATSQAVSRTGQKQHSFFRTRKLRVVELAGA